MEDIKVEEAIQCVNLPFSFEVKGCLALHQQQQQEPYHANRAKIPESWKNNQ